MLEMKDTYGIFYEAFVQMHKDLVANGGGHAGHGVDHDLMVASYCLIIAEDEKVSKMAWVAGLLHSIDRFFGVMSEVMINFMLNIVSNDFDELELAEIKTAILRHDKPNALDDSLTQIILQDADRLANLGPIALIRSGQCHPTLPAIELEATGVGWAKGSTYKIPLSCKDELLGHLEWETGPRFGLRTEKAKKIGKKYFDFLREFFELTNKQFIETGLDKFEI